MSDPKIKIQADTKDFDKGVKEVKDGFADLNKSIKGFSSTASRAVGSFIGNLSANAVSAGFSAINNGFRSAVANIREFIEFSKVQEQALNDFNSSLVRTGKFSVEASKDFQKFASELQNSSQFGDELILKNAAIIQSLGQLSNEGLKRATQAAADLSAGLGEPFEATSKILGEAAAGNVGALNRFGITIEQTGDKAKDFEKVLQALEARFGGSSQQQIKTFGGASIQLGNTIGDLKEKFGDLFTQNPQFIGAINVLQAKFVELGEFVEANKGELQDLVTEGFQFIISSSSFLIQSVASITTAFLGARNAYLEFVNAAMIRDLEEELANLPEQIDIQGNKVKTFYEQALETRIAAMKGEREEEAASFEKRIELIEGFQEKIKTIEDDLLAAKSAKSQEEIEKERERLSEIALLQAEQRELDLEQQRLDAENLRLAEREKLEYIRAILGEEEALREEARAKELAAVGDYSAAENSIEAARVKARKSDIFTLQKFEQLSQRERLANLQSSLSQISSLQSSSSKELFAIGKASAIATATIDGFQAIQKALASAPPPFNFGLAAIVGAAQALNIKNIASAKPPTGAFDGAFVDKGSSFKDTEPFMLSKGEVVAPARDFDDVVEGTARQRGFVKREEIGQVGSDSRPQVNIYYPMMMNEDSINIIIEKIRDAIQFNGADIGVGR